MIVFEDYLIGDIPRYAQLLSCVTSKLFNDCADNLDDLCIMFPVNDPYFKLAIKQIIEYKANHNPLDSFSRLSQNSKNMILYILSHNQQDNIHGMKDLQKIFDTNAYSQGVLRQLFATGIILKFVEFCDCNNYELQLLGLKAIKHIIGLPTTNDNYFSHAIVYGFIKVLQRLTQKEAVHITILCKIIHGIIRHKHDQLDEIKDGKWKVSITQSMITAGLNQQYQTKIYVITDMFRSIMSDGPIFGNHITYQELDDIISNMVLLLHQLNVVDHENNNNKNVNADQHFIVRAGINLIWSISYLCKQSRGINDNDCNTENIIDFCTSDFYFAGHEHNEERMCGIHQNKSYQLIVNMISTSYVVTGAPETCEYNKYNNQFCSFYVESNVTIDKVDGCLMITYPVLNQTIFYETFLDSKKVKEANKAIKAGEAGGLNAAGFLACGILGKICNHPALIYEACAEIENKWNNSHKSKWKLVSAASKASKSNSQKCVDDVKVTINACKNRVNEPMDGWEIYGLGRFDSEYIIPKQTMPLTNQYYFIGLSNFDNNEIIIQPVIVSIIYYH